MKKNLMVIFFALIACNAEIKKEEQNVETVKRMFEAFNAHDWAKMYSYYTTDARYLDPAFGIDYVTKTEQEIVGKYEGMEKYFPNIHDELLGLYPSGDKVTVEFISSGKAADGTSFKLPIVSVLTLKDGKIIMDATYYDNQ
jgi:ketosteroid isomerase-like protein